MKVQPALGYYRKVHYTFMFLLTILAGISIAASVFWIQQGIKAVFQSGILGINYILVGIIIGAFITSSVVDFFTYEPYGKGSNNTDLTRNANFTLNHIQKENIERLRHRREKLIFQRASPVIITAAIISAILTGIYIYNLIYILANECPKCHSLTTTSESSIIHVYMMYDHLPKEDYYRKKEVLLLRYNITNKQIIHKMKSEEPHDKNYNKWFMKEYEYTQNNTDLLCIKKNDYYSFIEQEITSIIDKRNNDKSLKIQNDYIHMNTNDNDEWSIQLHDMVLSICRNEYAITIVIIVFLFIWEITLLALTGYNIFLITV